jgi:hypothetical protein
MGHAGLASILVCGRKARISQPTFTHIPFAGGSDGAVLPEEAEGIPDFAG